MAPSRLILLLQRNLATQAQTLNRHGKLQMTLRPSNSIDALFPDLPPEPPYPPPSSSSSQGSSSSRSPSSISSLKVKWRKDFKMDEAIENDKKFVLCHRICREVLNEPGQVIPIRYLEKRRKKLRLQIKATTFLKFYPGLFDAYRDQIKPKGEAVPFIRPSARLVGYLEEVRRIHKENEALLVDKIFRLLMMACDRRINAEKLVHVKRDFGLPDDFLSSLVPKYPQKFRLVGGDSGGPSYLEVAEMPEELPLSVVEQRALKESEISRETAVPAFNVCLPTGMLLKKEMMEWTRDWIDRPYISPYLDCSHLNPSSPEMEKRTVGLIHEVLSLCVLRRLPVPILGKFCDDFRLSNAFVKVFTRHPGIFYLSLKGGIKTAMLREAYDNERLIDREPLLEIREKFCELVLEGIRTSNMKKIETQQISKGTDRAAVNQE